MSTYDVIIVGAGPGGYVSALRCAQLGMNVAVIDERLFPGGTCLHDGCIPSKTLLHITHHYDHACYRFRSLGIECGDIRFNLETMHGQRRAVIDDLGRGVGFLFRKHKITHIAGQARITEPGRVDVSTQTLTAPRIILATGSTPITLPNVDYDPSLILDSTSALALDRIPRHLAIIGGGYIGIELGSVWNRLGSALTIIEGQDRLLPASDKEVSTFVQKMIKRDNVRFRLGQTLRRIHIRDGHALIHVDAGNSDVPDIVEADAVLMALGRKPREDSFESLSLAHDEQGRIRVNDNYETSCAGIYAIGDLVPGPMLAHKAMAEGIVVAERLHNQKSHVRYGAIPSVMYTTPEVASIGVTEEYVQGQGTPHRIGRASLSANGRAKACHDATGFVKLIVHQQTDAILGAHIVAPQAGALIHEVAVAIELGGSSEDIARICHAHPTYNESIYDAAWSLMGGEAH